MAKAPTSVIGVDLGRYALKSVLLQRKGAQRYVVSNYATHTLAAPIETAEQLGREVKSLFKEMGGTAKACAIGISSPDALLRIIDQQETPPHILRDALRLNGLALLNQDCKEFVLDCDEIPSTEPAPPAEPGEHPKKRYLVGGMKRTQVNQIADVFFKNGQSVGALQLAPICVFNAFEFAQPEIFNEQAFFLVDIGHTSSTMMLGAKRELVLVRQIDFGARILIETLMALSGESRESVLAALEQEDELMVENTRMALMLLAREVGSSIGFFEGRREEVIRQIWISGGPAKSKTIVKVLSEELHMPCTSWNALENCELALPENKRAGFHATALDFNVACGAAAELLNS